MNKELMTKLDEIIDVNMKLVSKNWQYALMKGVSQKELKISINNFEV